MLSGKMFPIVKGQLVMFIQFVLSVEYCTGEEASNCLINAVLIDGLEVII